MIRPLRILLTVVLGSQLCACATFMNGRDQDLIIRTTPAGAIAIARPTETTASTPGVIRLRRKFDYELAIQKEGWQTEYVSVTRRLSWWVYLNAMNFGIGIIYDMWTGASSRLVPDEINVQLKPEAMRIPVPPTPVLD